MTTLYLHIGLPKTGTTALQIFLTDNDAALKQNGICFPDLPCRYQGISRRRNAHFLIAPGAGGADGDAFRHPCAEYAAMLDAVAALGEQYGSVLLSDEAIWQRNLLRPDFWTSLCRDLRDRGLSLKVIVYLRRQDTFLESLYRQRVKSGTVHVPFSDYLASTDYPLDYLPQLEKLADLLGRENLIVRVYEKEQYRGAQKNIFSDFLDIFGLTMDDGFRVKKAVYNISMNGPWLELQRMLNSMPDAQKMKVMFQSMHDIRSSSPFATKPAADTLFRPGEREAFLETFAESNRRIALEFLGRADGVLFREPLPDLPEYQVGQRELLDSTILVYGRSIQLLEEQNRRLQADLKDLREQVLWYRLKRKFRSWFPGKSRA